LSQILKNNKAMSIEDLKTTIEHGVGSLAAAIDACRVEQVEKAKQCGNMPLQDHFAECPVAGWRDVGCSVSDSLNYLERLYAAVTLALERERTISEKQIDERVAVIADMMMGESQKDYSDELIACASEVSAIADRLLPPGKKHRKSKADCRKMVDQFVAEATACMQHHGLDLMDNGGYSLPLSYLQAWMEGRWGCL
jgi:hypothetical protein